MGFIDSYKHLEKLCGDMLQTQHGVSAYIAEMESTPNGSYRVQGWVEDLKCLKPAGSETKLYTTRIAAKKICATSAMYNGLTIFMIGL